MDMLSGDDILVLLKLTCIDFDARSVRQIASSLGLSKSGVARSLKRLQRAGLTDANNAIDKLAVSELLSHGIRYLWPTHPSIITLGIKTACSAESFTTHLQGESSLPIVLPLNEGPVRGMSIEPICKQAPFAALRDPKMHHLIAIVDAFRIGKSRERSLAKQELHAWLAAHPAS